MPKGFLLLIGAMMGFFKQIVHTLSRPGAKRFKGGYTKAWDIPNPQHEILVRGDVERTLYVYDSEPLKGVRKGQVITLETFRGDGAMTSRYTGGSWDTRDSGGTLMLYNGHPIGFSQMSSRLIEDAAKRGYAVKVAAKCFGFLPGYANEVKEIMTLEPGRNSVTDWIASANAIACGAPTEHGVIEYNEYDEKDYANISNRADWEFPHASLRIIPTPAGSSAKPHIGVYSQEGIQVSEVTARNGYKELRQIMDDNSHYYITACQQVSDYNGQVYYHFAIRYWR